ncbi:hypothetical protein [Stratiformator vulcanicus]|uniref:Uncharacterized protein n=1 Tax=Stratiformator vulcanicus TaxID=2527980 RepID=A0A517R4L0_9PLAN|nr:hypothetical protein [Stratiformator vulcanicus]QDT38815.1 hypothetical protein Pan189_32140 [Stratiformator vulcanicus]
MADREYSKHQKKVIQRYYDNREDIDKQKLAELVTTLYLATGKKRAKSWETATGVMERLKVPQSRIDHVVASDDPTVLAKVVEEIEKGKI